MSEDLVARWIENANAGTRSPDELFEAWTAVDRVVATDSESGWQLVLKLIEAAPDDKVLAAIAAGPLEDLIFEWSPLLIDRIETHARRDPKFRRCLTGVWLSVELSPEISNRIEKYTSTVVDPLLE
jgi:uncharacterized protein DUF6869